MNLNDNPIFLTQKRLVHRNGVLAATLIAALVGISLLCGLTAYRADPGSFPDFHSPSEAGKMFYGWTIGAEILVLIIGGFSRISRVLADERKAGLWDSNRLTPLKPSELIIGYWLGAALREFYMALVLAGTGLMIIVLAGLPVTFWLETQVLIFSTALFFGLIAVVVGMVFQRPQGGIILIILLFLLQSFSFAFPKFVLTNFILPTYAIVHLFEVTAPSLHYTSNDWGGLPDFFGQPFPPAALTLGLQFLVGIFLWRAAVRKTKNPFQPLVLRWEAVVVFGILLIVQHGLAWGLWHGKFPYAYSAKDHAFADGPPLLSIIHCGTILFGIIILAAASPQPETVRLRALRLGSQGSWIIFANSAFYLALILAAVGALVLLCQFGFTQSWEIYGIAAGNLLTFYLIFLLLFEFCRLHHRRRALGFITLWLFALCIVPFILAGVFSDSGFAKLSLFSPGIVALSNDNANLDGLPAIVAAHFVIAVLLFIGWLREWRRLLAKAATVQN